MSRTDCRNFGEGGHYYGSALYFGFAFCNIIRAFEDEQIVEGRKRAENNLLVTVEKEKRSKAVQWLLS